MVSEETATDLIALLRADQARTIDAYNALWHDKTLAEAELTRTRAELAGMCETTAQMERQIVAEQAARRAFEADAAQLRQTALSYVTSARYEEREKLRAELYVLATVEHPGRMLMQELKLLRELADDVVRWREASGDIRDLIYVFETKERVEKMKAGCDEVHRREEVVSWPCARNVNRCR